MLGLGPSFDRTGARSTRAIETRSPSDSPPRVAAWVRPWGLALILLIPLLSIVQGLALASVEGTAVWEVYDQHDSYTGLLVAERETDGKWSWTYREVHPQPPPQYREAGKGTAAGGPVHYVWASADGNESGTITVDEVNRDLAHWHNVTTGAWGKLRRPAP